MLDLVSVIIPTYNRSEMLKKALGSVLHQTYQNFEVIIIDNNSSDDTDNMVMSFDDERVKLLKINNNGIIAASRNLGINHSKGKWIAFLDSDDWWLPNKLEKVVKFCDSGYDLCYHDLRIVKKFRSLNFYKRKIFSYQVSKPVFNDLINLGNPICNSSVVASASLLKDIGGLCEDIDLIASEDYDCWIRLSKLTEKFKYIPETLGYYGIGSSNSYNPDLSISNLEYIDQKYIASFVKEKKIDQPVWWMYAYARALYLKGNYVDARKLLFKLTKRHTGLFIRFKIYFMIVIKKFDKE